MNSIRFKFDQMVTPFLSAPESVQVLFLRMVEAVQHRRPEALLRVDELLKYLQFGGAVQNRVFSVAVFYGKLLTTEHKEQLFRALMEMDDQLFGENWCAVEWSDEQEALIQQRMRKTESQYVYEDEGQQRANKD